MNAAFKKAELGTWVKKPMEQDEFTLEVPSVKQEASDTVASA